MKVTNLKHIGDSKMWTQPQTKDILTFDKYELYVNELVNRKYNYSVVLRQLTPKAKYSPYKIIFNYGFKTYEEALNYAVDFKDKSIQKLEENKAIKEAQKVKRAEENKVDAKDFYQIGDIVVNTWGYEQTNIEFYQVIKITARTIKVKRICSARLEDSYEAHGMACRVVPVRDKFIQNELKQIDYQLIVKKDGCLSSPERFYHFSKWDGLPKYESWYY